ncbi:MAG: NAD-dependent protein deacylase [Streptococcaceae bacterium]|jgi:NAD-dependent deacetylase|nr:NAD-dependent protein deacylase [Streptococcaceae bacterium]
MEKEEVLQKIRGAENVVYLTGAGVSTPSGIPDYRSMEGIYTTSGLKEPEYLLSHRALLYDTDDWYAFIKQLYHEEAKPNVIHEKMAPATVITQNIDGLHGKAGTRNLVEFHGTIATNHCEKCGQAVATEEFLDSYLHKNCGGIIRPDVVFYDEQIAPENISRAINALQTADLVVIVGTTFKVYPFAALIQYATPQADVLAINRDPVAQIPKSATYLGDAVEVFDAL